MLKLRPVASNQTELVTTCSAIPNISGIHEVTILFSYQTPVAAFISGVGFFKTSKKWSTTTSRHINKWMCENGISGELLGQDAKVGNRLVQEREQSFFDNLVS